ncbi:MAG: A/G-specific adenine glycosylase [Myxococcota bacterium]|nr:A/G-specific adenine glycosylase [Myxococcota bacterium]
MKREKPSEDHPALPALIQRRGERTRARQALIAWFDEVKRALPWRENQDPWRIWVSEIMLQQTRVSSVIGYFERFIARFPTPSALAEADPEELRALWAGLGYYARARNLQRAAQQVVERHRGEVPRRPEDFAALAGVGPYTRGAVLSIAFDLSLPLVDGNVERVFARLFAIRGLPKEGRTKKLLWAIAEAWVEGPRPGDFNQALMELGATCCTPKKPSCLLCPLSEQCEARRLGLTNELPTRPQRKAIPEKHRVAALCRDDTGQIWLAQRKDQGLLASLWEPPSVTVDSSASPTERQDALAPFSLELEGEAIARVQHGFTHQRWTLTLFTARLAGEMTAPTPAGDYQRYRRFPIETLDRLALSGPGLKLLIAAGLPLKARRGAGKTKTPRSPKR